MSYFDNWIAGEWRGSDVRIENINPSDTHDVIGHFAQADAQDLEDAIASAYGARKACRDMGIEARQSALDYVGRELMSRAEELGMLLSREEGKPLAEGRGEIYRAGQFFTYFAAETLRQLCMNADSVRPGIEIDVRREPMGVVGVISPWNFPTATASWKIAPALAFGNSVIWKPANLTPASAHALTDIIRQAGFPEGAFQLVMGSGEGVGDQLVADPRSSAVSFTGSYETGKRVAIAAAQNLTRCQLELGSKNALVVLDDADMETAVTAAVAGGYSGTGQKCTASSRLIVEAGIHDAFVEKLKAALEALKVGHALEEGTQMGPVASAGQLAANLGWMGRAVSEGAELATGGARLERPHEGYYMSPALLTRTTNDMAVNRAELFAPAAAVIKVDDYEEALSVANDTDYGLVGGIITQSLAKATHFRRHIETGCVSVNLPTAGTDYHVPFGGRKNSSSGPREQGTVAVEFYTQMKTSYIKAGDI